MFYEAKICSTMHLVLLLHSTNITYNYASHALILLHYIHIFFRYHFIFQTTL